MVLVALGCSADGCCFDGAISCLVKVSWKWGWQLRQPTLLLYTLCVLSTVLYCTVLTSENRPLRFRLLVKQITMTEIVCVGIEFQRFRRFKLEK